MIPTAAEVTELPDDTVTVLDAGRSFTWEQRQPGSTVAAHHVVTPLHDGGALVELSVVMSGVLGGVVGRLLGGRGFDRIDL